MNTFSRFPLALLCAALVVVSLSLVRPEAASAGSDERDHDRARNALQAGEVLPLKSLLTQLERTHPGQVLEVELEHEHGLWVYEFKLLQPDGRLVRLELDARTGTLLQQRVRERKRDSQ
ncbi:MAG: PepSY domain-containing protein [Hydrogenophaga sp.]|nr:PepSY domain-containing protein [Hydrogenophaga sp.]